LALFVSKYCYVCRQNKITQALTSKHLALAGEGGGLDGVVDGVVDAGLAGDGVSQPLERVISGLLHGYRGGAKQTFKKNGRFF
jgi:hypothetical protein